MRKLLDDKEWQSYLWNKVYRREMFKGVKFPVGRGLDEDLSVMHWVFHHAERVVYNESEFYCYYHRAGSISRATDERGKARNVIDRGTARWERYLFTREHPEYHAMLNKMANIVVSVNLAGLRYIYKHLDLFPTDYPDTVRQRINSVNLPMSKQMPEFFTPAKKVEYLLFKHCFPLYRFLAARVRK